jgi:hypothetical protein
MEALGQGQFFILPEADASEASLVRLRQNCLDSEVLEAAVGLKHILALMQYTIQANR